MKSGDRVRVVRNGSRAHRVDGPGFLQPGDELTIDTLDGMGRIFYTTYEGRYNCIRREDVELVENSNTYCNCLPLELWEHGCRCGKLI